MPQSFDDSRLPALSARALAVCQKRVDSIPDFEQLRTRHLGDDLTTYQQQLDLFALPCPVEEAWDRYIHRRPKDMWPGPLVKYLFSYSKRDQCCYYLDDKQAPSAHVGQQFYCLLTFGMPVGVVGMELLHLDEANKTIELAYIEGGLYRGVQFLKFLPDGPNQTRIEHLSYQRGEYPWVRALIPYAYLHTKTIGEFHAAVR